MGCRAAYWCAERATDIYSGSYAECSYPYELADKEKVGFVFPIYSWGPPPIVLQFLQGLSLSNYHSQYFFFVCSCGDDTGLAQQVFCDAVAANGWRCDAGFSVTMPNNYVLLPGFDVDSKEVEKRKLDDAVQRCGRSGRDDRGED